MKRLLLASLLLGLIPSASAGVYYYPERNESGIKVICDDTFSLNRLRFNDGTEYALKGDGKGKYTNPKFPKNKLTGRWANPKNIWCEYVELSKEEMLPVLCQAGLKTDKGIWSDNKINNAIASIKFGENYPDNLKATAYKTCNYGGYLK